MDLNNLKNNQICFCSSTGSVASATSSSSRSSGGSPDKQGLRTVHLRKQCGVRLDPGGNKLRPNNFGFSFRGGREFGTGFFISAVEKDSEAQYKGLKVGDQIVRINGLSVEGATHQEVVQLAQSHHQLTLTLKSVGIIPVKDKIDDPLTWRVVDSGNENSPGPQADVDRLLIHVPENAHLGCGICKGPDWRPGIFVQYTKPNSLARRCGLQPGDQILQCNRVSFLQIDFSYAVSVLKNAPTLDLVLKKGSGVDLFPGESSGYSSSSSVADEALAHSPSRCKRLSMVAEEGDEKNQRKLCQCRSNKTNLKPSGSIDSIFDSFASDTLSAHREKSKSIEILTDSSAKKAVTFLNHSNVSRTLLNVSKSCNCSEGSQTVIRIESREPGETESRPAIVPGCRPPSPVALLSPQTQVCLEDKLHIEKSPSSSSFSSSCSLSSAISQEIQRRNERRMKGTIESTKSEVCESIKGSDRQQRHQHDLLIAELKKKQKFYDRTHDLKSDVKIRQRVSESGEGYLTTDTRSPNAEPPPACPTPDYFSDTSLTDQSIETSHPVKSSILKFEEKNKHHPQNGAQKTVTFGQNSTKEITPLKNLNKQVKDKQCFGMSDKKNHDRVEMQSIESFDLTEPKQVAPKPPPVYFQPPSRNEVDGSIPDTNKAAPLIKISEYPTVKLREPVKFDFITRNGDSKGFDSELATTLSRSNLKNKTDAFANFSNGNLSNTGKGKPCNGVSSRYNGCHAIPPIIPMAVTQNQISNVKKALKTFEKNASNTVVLKIPKIN